MNHILVEEIKFAGKCHYVSCRGVISGWDSCWMRYYCLLIVDAVPHSHRIYTCKVKMFVEDCNSHSDSINITSKARII